MNESEEPANEIPQPGEGVDPAASVSNLPELRSRGPIVARWRELWRPALISVPLLSILTGLIFPVALAVPAHLFFPEQARGSLIVRNGLLLGSRLIGQRSQQPGDFHPRPSAAGAGYDALASGGTNLGPTNPKLRDGANDDPTTPTADESFVGVLQLASQFRAENGLSTTQQVPIDAVTRSGSGLDPHISVANANLQVARVARERGFTEEQVRRVVQQHTSYPQLGFIGSARVSVLELNLALDKFSIASPSLAGN